MRLLLIPIVILYILVVWIPWALIVTIPMAFALIFCAVGEMVTGDPHKRWDRAIDTVFDAWGLPIIALEKIKVIR